MLASSRFLVVLGLFIIRFLYVGNAAGVQCIESEREALLRFKQGFINPSGFFSSWLAEEDCCLWKGVGCNHSTGHVIALNLSGQHQTVVPQGEFSASLLDLAYLSYLDLSGNDFRQIQIPQSIGSLLSLENLNLSTANFRGTIPDHLGNLSRLRLLDLSDNSFSLKANNLYWISSLSSLEVLDLGGVGLSSAMDWLDAINMLPYLIELNLTACRLNNLQSSLPYVNFTSLRILDLSFNSLYSEIPHWLFNISQSLVSLNLRRSQLQGLIPNAFQNMNSLVFLDLSKNNLVGEIPTSLGLIRADKQVERLPRLRELHLSHNRLNGSLEHSLSQFSQLTVLDVASNFLEGAITEAQLLNFSRLRVLGLSSNLLIFNISSGWIPPFQLETIGLQSCQLGPHFPEWLQTQKNFLSLDISNASIADTVPHWFWSLSDKVQFMDLSSNQFTGMVPDFSLKVNLSTLDLSNNKFEGPLPQFSPSMVALVLHNNSFSGGISSICEILVPNNSLSYLDLSANFFSGEIPNCWTYGRKVVILNLAYNNLSGKIPTSIGHLVNLNTLHLESNSLSGELPLSMKNCTSLFALDLGSNELSGNIPTWIGEEMQKLMVLSLRVNAFVGKIPVQLCQLELLKILDLALNYLSGPIPRCINNFLAMGRIDSDRSYIYDPYTSYRETLVFSMKGFEFKVVYLIGFLKSLDLSSNRLTGDIPREIGSLVGLSILNLSRNHLTGTIPNDIGYLGEIESLDLSRNELSCTIPASLVNLTFLEVLNLSHNRLSGKIPSGIQFDTFEISSYMGNRDLCGRPLPNDCLMNASYTEPHCVKETDDENEDDDGDAFRTHSFYISVGLGFVAGFWGFCGTLLTKSSWRHAYYRFLGNSYDQICIFTVVSRNRLARKFQKSHVAKRRKK